MGFSLCFGIFILSFVVLHGVNAFEGDLNVMKNDFCLKKMKKVLPASNPDEFDCVEIYKQPAFDHPLLKNHKIQLEPSLLKDFKKFSSRSSCPPGKVPIAKATSHPGNLNSQNSEFSGRQFAVAESGLGYILHGARSLIELRNPHPLTSFQFSMAAFWVLGGPRTELNSLQAGWGVHPFLYNDTKTYLTIYWTADNYFKTGCYNARCPGFIQTHHSIYPGQSFDPSHVNGTTHYVVDLAIFQDEGTGNWWLIINKYIKIGYWPKQLFNHLVEQATHISYGGLASKLAPVVSPPMGNGNFPTEDIRKSSFFARARIFNSSYIITRSSTLTMNTRVDAPNCYNVIYMGNQGNGSGDLITYGGPGGTGCGV